MSDSKTAIYHPTGIDILRIEQAKSSGTELGTLGYTIIPPSELLELDVDCLIPAALENQITEINASKIRAKYVLELANGPTTPDAEAILGTKHRVIPDVLANAG